jgi:hypothetical protein
LSLQGVASSSSLLNHSGAGLDHVEGHTIAPAKPCESRVYDDDRARDLMHARGSFISRAGGGICRGLCGILRAGVRHAVTLISPLFTAVLWPRAVSLNTLRDLTHNTLCDPMRGLHGD